MLFMHQAKEGGVWAQICVFVHASPCKGQERERECVRGGDVVGIAKLHDTT